MRLKYRALEGTNTKMRRLAYLTAILAILNDNSLSERLLLTKLFQWSQTHQKDLQHYWVQTGEVSSTRRNSAGARYLTWAVKGGLIVSVSGAYRATRMGLTLSALLKQYKTKGNPFFLNQIETLFYLYWILNNDADIILVILEGIKKQRGISLAELQRDFQDNFLRRLEQKQSACSDSILQQHLRERRLTIAREWKKPARYAEHLVPPRLNWLLDLEFLEPGAFRKHRYTFTENGHKFVSQLPLINDNFQDITDEWLMSAYWENAATTLTNIKSPRPWEQINNEKQYELIKTLLPQTFKAFRYTFVPKIPLTQALLYFTFRALLDFQIILTPAQLKAHLTSPQVVDEKRYEVRLSPRENESYLLMTFV